VTQHAGSGGSIDPIGTAGHRIPGRAGCRGCSWSPSGGCRWCSRPPTTTPTEWYGR